MSAEILGRVAPRGAPLPLFGCSVSAGFPSPADDYAEAWLSLDELVGIRAPSTYLVRAGGDSMIGVVCGKGRNPTLRLWPAIFSGEIDVFPGDRRSRLISSMTSVAPA